MRLQRHKLAELQNAAVQRVLLAVQADLARGENGIEKLLGSNPEAIRQLLGERRYKGFREPFLEVL